MIKLFRNSPLADYPNSSLLGTHAIIRLLRVDGAARWQYMMQLLVALCG
ncbi:hypothetical protein ig2599ANME_1544 [groundwater metagenome]